MSEQKQSLQELRAKRAELDRAAADAEAAEIEKHLIQDEMKIAELRRPGMVVVDLGRRVALISKPSVAEFERFMSTELTLSDHLTFVRSCLVYPPADEIYQTFPAKITTLSEAAGKLAGIERKATAGK